VSIPDRFQPLEPSPFGELIGPLFVDTTGSLPIVAVRAASEHANWRGRVHGGLLMTLADVAVSRASVARIPPGSSIATASLQIAFLEGVGEGEWLQAVPSIDRIGRSLIHASCLIRAGEGASAGPLVARVLATVAVKLARAD
jgi:acyl-coenzyme A thioesterase 13